MNNLYLFKVKAMNNGNGKRKKPSSLGDVQLDEKKRRFIDPGQGSTIKIYYTGLYSGGRVEHTIVEIKVILQKLYLDLPDLKNFSFGKQMKHIGAEYL